MRRTKLKATLQDLNTRISALEHTLPHTVTDLHRALATIQHKLNAQSRVLDRLLQYSAAATGLEPPGIHVDDEEVTWSHE